MHSFFLWLHQIVDLATPNVFAMSMIGLFCHFNVMMAESNSLWNFLRVPALHTWNQPVSYYLLRMSWNKEKQASSFHKTTCQSIYYYLEGWVKLLEIILTLEFYLKVYNVITSWLFDVKSTVVVCWGKIEKKKSSYLLILTVSFDITKGISLPLLCACECGRREKIIIKRLSDSNLFLFAMGEKNDRLTIDKRRIMWYYIMNTYITCSKQLVKVNLNTSLPQGWILYPVPLLSSSLLSHIIQPNPV